MGVAEASAVALAKWIRQLAVVYRRERVFVATVVMVRANLAMSRRAPSYNLDRVLSFVGNQVNRFFETPPQGQRASASNLSCWPDRKGTSKKNEIWESVAYVQLTNLRSLRSDDN